MCRLRKESLVETDMEKETDIYVDFTPTAASVCGRSLAGIASSNPAGGVDVCVCECCLLSGRGLYDGLITCPEESCRVGCVRV